MLPFDLSRLVRFPTFFYYMDMFKSFFCIYSCSIFVSNWTRREKMFVALIKLFFI